MKQGGIGLYTLINLIEWQIIGQIAQKSII